MENELIASVHLACGAAGGIYVQKYLPAGFSKESRWVATFFSGLVSHMILDAWPHWEYTQGGSKLLAILLVETALVLVCIFSVKRSRIVNCVLFLGMVGGAVPDLFLMIWERFLFWNPLLYFHFITHIFHGLLPVFQIGWFFQIILAIIAIIYTNLKSA